MFFEGSEKKVEMVFEKDHESLRNWPREVWSQIVAKANAAILSQISNRDCDAYLLSESSLFVYEHRLIMITCGETSLISAIEEIFKYANLNQLVLLVFERKNEIQPEQQPSDFIADVAFLKHLVNGRAVRFGGEAGSFIHCFYYERNYQPIEPDVTLEILMHDLDPIAEKRFAAENRTTLYAETRIHQLFPDFETDDYFFHPIGYSLNSLGPGGYYTVHVTPQSHCSYASFETNYYFQADIQQTIEKVAAIFRPKSFSVLIFESRCQPELQLTHYQLQHRETLEFAGYQVRYYDFIDLQTPSPAANARSS